jgi:Protein of unknown function DUF262/Protein of unknown function (DUF1524)
MAELTVAKKSVSNLLSEMQRRKFIIPDYQRPYKWDKEKCETLWRDLTGFFEDRRPDENPGQEYFLGTIVTCQSNEGAERRDLEVIDGQQRITSFLLLLRAFYRKLERMPIDPNVSGLMNQIAPCIWNVNSISGLVDDKNVIHIDSRVATEKDNDTFHEILKKGQAPTDACDLYSLNFRYFFDECEKYARDLPTTWQALCVSILKNCIIFPIECEKLDTALEIFSTLNNRGMPLSDSDIFKAQIYRSKATSDEKSRFTADWKELTETVEDAGITLDDVFRYYSHVIRAREGDKGKEISLRKFYAGSADKWLKLTAPQLMPEIAALADFWLAINEREDTVDGADVVMFTFESKKLLQCLTHYPNEYWKYVTSVYFCCHKNDADFKERFPVFLRFLVSFLFAQYIQRPTVNAIRDACYQFGMNIDRKKPIAEAVQLPEQSSSRLAETSESKLARALVLLHAYLSPQQTQLVPEKFEIEHILPRKWQTANYLGWNHDEAKESLERFGNKVAFEKKLNIQAGNGYFGKKKPKYAASVIAEAKKLSFHPSDDWQKTDINTRDQEFLDSITAFFSANLNTGVGT